MLFNKKLAVLAVLAGSMVAGSALAADGKKGAEVTFKAQLRAQSCDVSSTTTGSVVDWGTFTKDVTDALAPNAVLGDEKSFDLVLSNCSADAADTSMNVFAQGQAAAGFPALFANQESKALAVKLASGAVNITPNADAVVVIDPKVAKDGGAVIPMKANLILTKTGVPTDKLSVPVTFTVSYN
ncbi:MULTISPECIES: fimbrial protein [Providencia]|uniref:Fimbrial protein n=3 Tax=Morganellaceae TaxID=1903414 RepID=A0A264VMS1_PRORE|nr:MULTISPECIES: type 1 fimbrial protein [Providencia]MRF65318.1 type 1 fimbrial protein [Escherichia coli]EHZ6874123.1 type 1 fimbrial protein [Providencia rettgeri]MBG5894705.1 type 1 fimbrial protein [Providencia rettgeri]MBG5929534.1 type 1 fimbrial protein [Providencia rettgeri]MBI6191485.1 type 1 fimbrial protein [Providencia rettgeri]